jgi:HlyD family secretion protein
MNSLFSSAARTTALLCVLAAITACTNEETTYLVGTLERDRIDLVVESDEPITRIAVADGSRVAVGDTVIAQDDARARGRLDRVRGQRDQAAARLAELRRGPRPELIDEARARLESSRASRENAQANWRRAQEIFDRGLGSQQDVDQTRTRFETATAQVKADTDALNRLLNGTTVEELDQARAALEALQATVRLAEVDLARTKVRAPVSGVVDKVLYRLGERPAPGTTVAVILDDTRVYARVYVPERLRSRITPGVAMDVRVDGMDQALKGRVRWVSADATFTPYFALTEHDRSRLSFLAEIDVPDATELPSGVPLEVDFQGLRTDAVE